MGASPVSDSGPCFSLSARSQCAHLGVTLLYNDTMSRRFVLLAAFAVLIALAVLSSGCAPLSRPWQSPLPEHIVGEALQVALSKVGCPYIWGAQGPDAFDCSGLVIWAYQQAYRSLILRYGDELVEDVTADSLWRWNVLKIPPHEMIPGDLVFITDSEERVTHVGLFIRWIDDSEFEFVNASSYAPPGSQSGGEVRIDRWPVTGTKRGQWFVGAGRLLTCFRPGLLISGASSTIVPRNVTRTDDSVALSTAYRRERPNGADGDGLRLLITPKAVEGT